MTILPSIKILRNDQRGFTLFELMIAVAILASMGLMMMQITNGVILGRNTLQERITLEHSVEVTLSKMYDDINAAFLADTTMQGKQVTGFVGDQESLNFSTMSHLHFLKNAKDSDQVDVGYFLKKNQEGNLDLMRRETDYLTEELDRGGKSFLLVSNLKSLEFSYFDSNQKDWSEKWDTSSATAAGRLPSLVKISMIVYGRYEDENELRRREYPYELIVPVVMCKQKVSF